MKQTREPELEMPMATWHLYDTQEVTQEQHLKSESYLLLRHYSLWLLSKCIKKVIEALWEAPAANEEVVYVECQKTYSQFKSQAGPILVAFFRNEAPEDSAPM